MRGLEQHERGRITRVEWEVQGYIAVRYTQRGSILGDGKRSVVELPKVCLRRVQADLGVWYYESHGLDGDDVALKVVDTPFDFTDSENGSWG